MGGASWPLGMMFMTDNLDDLRNEIDAVDDRILELIAARMDLSDRVTAAKAGKAAFRPGREAALMRRLASQRPDISGVILLGIWRQILAASLSRQDADLHFIVHADVAPTATWHMGSALQARYADTISEITTLFASQADQGDTPYALVPADNTPELAAWLYEEQTAFVIARTPLFDMDAVPPAYIIGPAMPDASGDDISLIGVLNPDAGYMIKSEAGYYPDGMAAQADDARILGIYAR